MVNLSLGYLVAASHEMNPSVWARLPKEVTDRVRGLDKASKQPGKKGKSSKNFKKKQARSVELTDGTSVAADADAGGKQLKKSALVMVLASASLLQITEVNQSTLTRCLPLPTSLYHCLTPQSLKMLWRLCQST